MEGWLTWGWGWRQPLLAWQGLLLEPGYWGDWVSNQQDRPCQGFRTRLTVSFHPVTFQRTGLDIWGGGPSLERARPTDPILASVALHPAGTQLAMVTK